MLRRYLLIAAMTALWPISAFAQTPIPPLPVAGNLTASAATVVGDPDRAPSLIFQLAGTWTGTVTFECRTVESLAYVSALATSVTDGSLSTTATANGAWAVFNVGYSSCRANFSTPTSGTVIAAINPGYAVARVASPQFSNVVANSFCMSASTKDSYFAEVGANNPGAYTNGANCAGGTLRFDWNASRLNLLFGQGIATTSTDSLVIANATAATGGATVQMSPRLRYCGNAWDTAASKTVCFFEEVLPVTAATPTGTFKLGYSVNGGAATYPMTVTSTGDLTILNNLNIAAAGFVDWAGRMQLQSSDDALMTFNNAALTSGVGFDVSTDSTLKVRTRAQTGYGTVDALAYNASGAAGVSGTCDTPTFTGGVATTCGGSGGSVDGTYFVTSNFTTANNTNLQAITGLAWTFPVTTAINVPFRCSLTYSQATAAVSDSLGIQDVTVAPTNGMFTGSAETALGTTAYGDLTAFSSTTATAVVTFTPSAITTIFNAYIDGMIEQPSNASTSVFQIQIKTTTGANAITVYRGSYCKVG